MQATFRGTFVTSREGSTERRQHLAGSAFFVLMNY
jgi:hypothetical protein